MGIFLTGFENISKRPDEEGIAASVANGVS
jgi:hypothetical protein